MFNSRPPPPTPLPDSPQRPRPWEKLGGSDAVHLFIYLSRSFISRYKWPWRLTTTESPTAALLPLPQTRLVCEEGVINIKNTQISEEQWILLEAGEGKLEVLTFSLCMSQLSTAWQNYTSSFSFRESLSYSWLLLWLKCSYDCNAKYNIWFCFFSSAQLTNC